MSGQEKWMPSPGVAGQTMKEHTYEAHKQAVLDLCHRTGIRAQIAALEELVPAVCPDCADGAMDDGSFNHYAGVQVSEDDWEQTQFECRASVLREKLAALRKELA